jgi:hypothetical protein
VTKILLVSELSSQAYGLVGLTDLHAKLGTQEFVLFWVCGFQLAPETIHLLKRHSEPALLQRLKQRMECGMYGSDKHRRT